MSSINLKSYINLSAITCLHSVIIMLESASTGPSGPPMHTPSICSYNFLLKDNAVFWQVSSRINFFSEGLGKNVLISFLSYTRLRIMLTVLLKGTFVNNE